LTPRDKDIRANLALAQSQAVDLFTEEAAGPIKGLAEATGDWLTLDETAVIALGLWFVLGFLLLAWRQLQPGSARRGVKYVLMVTAALLVLTGFVLGSRLYTDHAQSDGVVVADTVAVSSGPEEGRATEFSLHSGAQVQIVESSGDWLQLEMPGNVVESWVPRETVEMIDGLSRGM
jgi:hypothetical protein